MPNENPLYQSQDAAPRLNEALENLKNPNATAMDYLRFITICFDTNNFNYVTDDFLKNFLTAIERLQKIELESSPLASNTVMPQQTMVAVNGSQTNSIFYLLSSMLYRSVSTIPAQFPKIAAIFLAFVKKEKDVSRLIDGLCQTINGENGISLIMRALAEIKTTVQSREIELQIQAIQPVILFFWDLLNNEHLSQNESAIIYQCISALNKKIVGNENGFYFLLTAAFKFPFNRVCKAGTDILASIILILKILTEHMSPNCTHVPQGAITSIYTQLKSFDEKVSSLLAEYQIKAMFPVSPVGVNAFLLALKEGLKNLQEKDRSLAAIQSDITPRVTITALGDLESCEYLQSQRMVVEAAPHRMPPSVVGRPCLFFHNMQPNVVQQAYLRPPSAYYSLPAVGRGMPPVQAYTQQVVPPRRR